MPGLLGEGARMKAIHVLRKPLSEGTITANVLKHGTGALNIDATRVSTSDNLNGGAYSKNASERHDGDESWRFKNGGRKRLLPGDERDEKSAGMYKPGAACDYEYKQPSGRWPSNVVLQHLDGCRETADNWVCEPGCPVAALDAQTGSLKSGIMTGMQRGWGKHGIYGSSGDTLATCYADSGGASRFYKQTGGKKSNE
jgi:site-specific DNA-methyltransferase (adenine-specific)